MLREVPSLDLYRDDDPFRTPKLSEYRDWIDVLEFGVMKTGAFPEPLTFSLRALRALRARPGRLRPGARQPGAGLRAARPGPARPAAGDQHPPPDQRGPADRAGPRPAGWARVGKWRWYSFVRMQGRVARRVGPVLTASQASRADICRDFRVDPGQRARDPARRGHPAVPPPASAPGARPDRGRGQRRLPAQGGGHAARRPSPRSPWSGTAQLIVVGKPAPGGPTERLVGELALGDRVRFVHGISDTELAELCAQRRDRGGSLAVRGVLVARR